MSMIRRLVNMVDNSTRDLSDGEVCKFIADENFKHICGNYGTYNLFLDEYRYIHPEMKEIMDKHKLDKKYTANFDYSRKE